MLRSVQDAGRLPKVPIMYNMLKTQKIMMPTNPLVSVVPNVTIFTEYSKFLSLQFLKPILNVFLFAIPRSLELHSALKTPPPNHT